MKVNRRNAIKKCLLTGAALPFAYCAASIMESGAPGIDQAVALPGETGAPPSPLMEVPHYDKLEHNMVQCKICPRECKVGDTERGFCGNKENHGGTYHTLAYGNPCAANVDPIEKKPLFHYLPGTKAFSISTAGCNFDCKFCQNWELSQARPEQTRNYDMPPASVADFAIQSGSTSIAYTYGEPVVYYKYAYDTAVAGKKKNIRSVMISNGYINPEPMRNLCGVLDAVKIDYKSHTEKFYEKTCIGHLEHVQKTLLLLKDIKMWFEMVYLMVPTLNGEAAEIKEMARWIMDNLGPDVPLHFSRFHPIYKLKNLQPTPLKMLDRAYEICRAAGLHYVYIGNVPGHEGESTYCPKCGKVVISRYGFVSKTDGLKDGACASCATKIPGVWK